MSTERLAIIGTGIAGLGCAHFLQSRFDLTLFEQADYPGGHTNTIAVPEGSGHAAFDTGFMVYNEVTYPHLTRLFRELGVRVKPTQMSFSVQHRPSGIEFSGSSVNHLFAQRRNLLRPRFWRMLAQVNRFNTEAVAALTDPAFAAMTVADYVRARCYGDDFLRLYLVPMSGAVWSTPPQLMLEFPAITLLRFFHNHGFLGLHTQHPWLTVDGGAKHYVDKLLAPLRAQNRVRLNAQVTAVRRTADSVDVTAADGRTEHFDRVILAAHADQSLALLTDADATERRLLGAFRYQPNLATVHTDASVMPRTRLAWASWNYRVERDATGREVPSTIYWMNSLQGLSDRVNYFVSINGAEQIAPDKILRRIEYHHPLFNLAATQAQTELPSLNTRPANRVFFAGSYFKNGFHEDAFASALDCSRAVSGERIWE